MAYTNRDKKGLTKRFKEPWRRQNNSEMLPQKLREKKGIFGPPKSSANTGFISESGFKIDNRSANSDPHVKRVDMLPFQDNGIIENRYLEMREQREMLRQRYIMENKMDDPSKKYDISEARAIVGECKDMCPEYERFEREYQNGLMEFEKIPGTNRIDHSKAVKRYRRSAADDEMPLPCDIRPLEVLETTLDYLLLEVVGEYGLEKSHSFVRDRTRAIRKDLTIQNITGPGAIGIYEKIARYHMVCSQRLCGKLELKQEYEQLEKTLQSLMEFYDECMIKGIKNHSEPEFRSYYLLHYANNSDVQAKFEKAFAKYCPELLRDPHILMVIHLRGLLPYSQPSLTNYNDTLGKDIQAHQKPGNFESFTEIFNIMASSSFSYLMGCAVHPHINHIRRSALKSMGDTFYILPSRLKGSLTSISWLEKILYYDSKEDLVTDLETLGIRVQEIDHVQKAYIGKVKEKGLILNKLDTNNMGSGNLKLRVLERLIESKVYGVPVLNIIYNKDISEIHSNSKATKVLHKGIFASVDQTSRDTKPELQSQTISPKTFSLPQPTQNSFLVPPFTLSALKSQGSTLQDVKIDTPVCKSQPEIQELSEKIFIENSNDNPLVGKENGDYIEIKEYDSSRGYTRNGKFSESKDSIPNKEEFIQEDEKRKPELDMAALNEAKLWQFSSRITKLLIMDVLEQNAINISRNVVRRYKKITNKGLLEKWIILKRCLQLHRALSSMENNKEMQIMTLSQAVASLLSTNVTSNTYNGKEHQCKEITSSFTNFNMLFTSEPINLAQIFASEIFEKRKTTSMDNEYFLPPSHLKVCLITPDEYTYEEKITCKWIKSKFMLHGNAMKNIIQETHMDVSINGKLADFHVVVINLNREDLCISNQDLLSGIRMAIFKFSIYTSNMDKESYFRLEKERFYKFIMKRNTTTMSNVVIPYLLIYWQMSHITLNDLKEHVIHCDKEELMKKYKAQITWLDIPLDGSINEINKCSKLLENRLRHMLTLIPLEMRFIPLNGASLRYLLSLTDIQNTVNLISKNSPRELAFNWKTNISSFNAIVSLFNQTMIFLSKILSSDEWKALDWPPDEFSCNSDRRLKHGILPIKTNWTHNSILNTLKNILLQHRPSTIDISMDIKQVSQRLPDIVLELGAELDKEYSDLFLRYSLWIANICDVDSEQEFTDLGVQMRIQKLILSIIKTYQSQRPDIAWFPYSTVLQSGLEIILLKIEMKLIPLDIRYPLFCLVSLIKDYQREMKT